MARDGAKPGPKGSLLIPALPLEMNGKQGFLHNILGVGIGHSCWGKAPACVGTKHWRQQQQQTPVGIAIARIARAHQKSPLLFFFLAAHKGSICLLRTPGPVCYVTFPPSLSRFCHGEHAQARVTPARAAA